MKRDASKRVRLRCIRIAHDQVWPLCVVYMSEDHSRWLPIGVWAAVRIPVALSKLFLHRKSPSLVTSILVHFVGSIINKVTSVVACHTLSS